MHPLVHLVAHTRGGFVDVVAWESAVWLWTHLRDTFPMAIAASLMPDHLHLATLLYDHTLSALRRLLQHHSRRFGCAWDLGPPTPIHTRAILGRTAKYIWLNAVRDGLVDDPLAWPWSTLRDALGTTTDPWGGPDTIGRWLELPTRRVHAFATDDASCDRRARAPITILHPSDGLAVNLAAVADACASSLRCHVDALRQKCSPMRPLLVDVVHLVAAPRTLDLAGACNMSPRSLRDIRGRAPASHIRAALTCLGDPRLRIWSVQPR